MRTGSKQSLVAVYSCSGIGTYAGLRNRCETMSVRAVCVFCGSRMGGHEKFRKLAEAAGSGLAARGVTVVYGGGALGLLDTAQAVEYGSIRKTLKRIVFA